MPVTSRNHLAVPVAVMSFAVALAVVAGPAVAEPIRCPVVKDVWIATQNEERNHSMGKTDRMKLKVLQEMGLIGFDVSALKGKKIRSAELYLHPVEGSESRFVEGRATDLRWVIVSTVTSPWVEGSGDQSYKPDPQGHGATYLEASYQRQPWAWEGSKLSAVINGQLNSVYSVNEIVPAEGGYWKVPVDGKVVQALVAGLSDGVCVMDGSGTHATNPFVYTRESKGKAPYLLVEVEGEQAAKPAAPDLQDILPDEKNATLEKGAIRLQVLTPPETFGFHVKIDGEQVEPWQVEWPSNPGGINWVTIEDLPAGKQVEVEVAAVDAAGNLSDWSSRKGKVSDKVSVPDLPGAVFKPKPGEPVKVGEGLVAWAFPEVVEVDPVTALPMYEKDKKTYRNANPVWSGAEGKVRLAAARGEIVAFQLGLEQQGEQASAQVSVHLRDPAGQTVGANHFKLYRVWYVPSETGEGEQASVRWNPEYLVPIAAGKIRAPMEDNKIDGQRLQAVYVDIAIPGSAPAGTYSGEVRIKADGGEASLPLEIQVYPVRIPDELNFNPELNTYSGPARAGTKEFFDWHRLAHYNRCTLNRVPYSQNGSINEDMIPSLGGKGADTHVADWSEYDRRVGPLLDGSAFKDLPRAHVPVKSFYLPMFENWPMGLEDHYQMGMPPAEMRRGEDNRDRPLQIKERHDLTVKPIEEAFDQAYKAGFKNVTSQFLKHYEKNGWTRTLCQMYQNNKFNFGGQWWTLDEPKEWSDWNALAFFARLFHEAIAVPHEAQFLYRGDISRPQWQGGFMDGYMDIIYSGSSGSFGYSRLLQHMKQRDGMLVYVYGSCNPVERNSFESAAWCLKAYGVGGDGVLPWQSVGKDASFDEPNHLGLLVSGKRFAMTAVPSMRVMALRHGAQQCELLKQVLDRHRNWSRTHAMALVGQKVPLTAIVNLRWADEAAAATFGEMTAENFLELKEGLLQMLSPKRDRKEQTAPAAGEASAVREPSEQFPGVYQPQVVTYKTVDGQPLEMHVVEPVGGGEKRPAVIWFVCGAWRGFNPAKHYAQNHYLATRGVVNFAAQVRVQPVHGTTPAECVTDGKSAVRWVRQHAARFGVDPDRIAVAGASAAGHVSASTALIDGFDDPRDDVGVSAVPNAAALFCPAVNTHSLARRMELFGGMQRAKSLSPVLHVEPGAPPMLVQHGQDDAIIVIEEIEEFVEKMRAAGNRCDLVVYPEAGHGFQNWYAEQRNPLFYESMRNMDQFLTSLGWIEGEPTIDVFAYNEPDTVE